MYNFWLDLGQRAPNWSTMFGLVVLPILVIATVAMPQNDTQPLPFDPVRSSISDIHAALISNKTSALEITNIYLTRITSINPQINALITLNPDLLRDAQRMDAELTSRPDKATLLSQKPLFAIPTLFKDNYDALPMATTAGCCALNSSIPTSDAASVAALRNAGALILGKANLHELALEGLTVSSLGGQTLNPFDFSRTPGGSSGGSGAALGAGLTVLATGSDTVNSLRSPASANSVFSCRPTRGLVSRFGIVSSTYFLRPENQGNMRRKVLNVFAGPDFIYTGRDWAYGYLH